MQQPLAGTRASTLNATFGPCRGAGRPMANRASHEKTPNDAASWALGWPNWPPPLAADLELPALGLHEARFLPLCRISRRMAL